MNMRIISSTVNHFTRRMQTDASWMWLGPPKCSYPTTPLRGVRTLETAT